MRGVRFFRYSTLTCSPGQASRKILEHNSAPLRGRETEFIRRLQKLVHQDKHNAYSWGSDIIIKMFGDIDRVLFGKSLLGYCTIAWMSKDAFVQAGQRPTTRGLTCVRFDCSGMAHVKLNADEILLRTAPGKAFQVLWKTSLHEMIVSNGLFALRLVSFYSIDRI